MVQKKHILRLINDIKQGKLWELMPTLKEDELEEIINLASTNYFEKSQSLIPDADYDRLVDRLKMINRASPVLQEIGARVQGKKTKLPFWMGSMDKIKSNENLIEKWSQKYPGPYVISDKLDGISLLLYKRGTQINLYTRGNGSIGTNVSFLLKYLSIPKDTILQYPKDLAIRGELIMTKEKFRKYQKTMENARNMVGGIVHTKEESLNKKHVADVDFCVYEVLQPRSKPEKQLELLRKLRMKVVYYQIYHDLDLELLEGLLKKRIEKSIYEIDGLIVTQNKKNEIITSGNPPYSFAYKGETEAKEVEVIEVLWNVTKDKYLVPRIHYTRVKVSQANLEFATGFNAKFILDNKIGPGAIIKVVRSGGSIPYVMDVIKPAKISGLPTQMDYRWEPNGVNIILKGKNDNLSIKRLVKFIENIGVENMSSGIVKKLFSAGYQTIESLVQIKEEDLLKIEGFGEKLAEKIIKNLENSLANLDLATFIYASNYLGRGFALKKIKKILQAYPDIIRTYDKKHRKSWEKKLLALEGFQNLTVQKVLDNLPALQKFYLSFIKISPIRKEKKRKQGEKFEKTVVFTGFRSREIKKWIEERGGRVTESVSKKTDLVIYTGTDKAKYQKAIQLKIPVITKEAFQKKYMV